MSSDRVPSCLRLALTEGRDAAAKGSNFVFSPLSIHAALALVADGAKGRTLEQMRSFLGYPGGAGLRSATARILYSIRIGRTGSTEYTDTNHRLSFANSIWVESWRRPLNPSFVETAAYNYGAIAMSVDFKSKADEVTNEINNWVEKKTDGVIKDVIPDEAVDKETSIVLANALYYKAFWDVKFERHKTKHGKFYLPNGSIIAVPFMNREFGGYYISSSYDFKVLKLPYKEGPGSRRFSMLIFLPDDHESDGIYDLMDEIISTPCSMKLHKPTQWRRVRKLMLPKFKFSFAFDASNALKRLGLELPFSEEEADLTGMLNSPPRSVLMENLYINAVLHKSTIEVTEEGTNASASTIPGLHEPRPLHSFPLLPEFVADHPFLFAIIEEEHDAVLFLGLVIDPSQGVDDVLTSTEAIK